MSCCTRCGGVTYCSDCDADHFGCPPDQETAWLRARVDQLEAVDARLTRARVAMDQGPIPGVEPYPLPTAGDPPLSEYDRAQQAGWRVVPLEERIRRLIEAHEYVSRLAIAATRWNPAEQPPDNNRTVLVCFYDDVDSEDMVWTGYYDSTGNHDEKAWYDDNGMPTAVLAWRELPAAPAAHDMPAPSVIGVDHGLWRDVGVKATFVDGELVSVERECSHCVELDQTAAGELDGDIAQSLFEYRELTGHWPSCQTQAICACGKRASECDGSRLGCRSDKLAETLAAAKIEEQASAENLCGCGRNINQCPECREKQRGEP